MNCVDLLHQFSLPLPLLLPFPFFFILRWREGRKEGRKKGRKEEMMNEVDRHEEMARLAGRGGI
jgi:hypothetical protein